MVKRRLEAGAITGEPAQRAAHCLLAVFAANVGWHGAVHRLTDPGAVQPGEQIAKVRIAKKLLVAGCGTHALDCLFGNPVRTVAAAREPYPVKCRIIRAFQQRGEAHGVWPGEMAVGLEALWVKVEFDIGKFRFGQRHDQLRVFMRERGRGCTNGDTGHGSGVTGLSFARKPIPVPGMTSSPADLTSHPWFFCGIGGSGMLPLALILRGQGAEVAGSDRSRDQGRTPEKFCWLESLGFALFPQDGSGIASADQVLVASAAVEDTVPEMVRAKELGVKRMSRAELLAELFNAAPQGLAIGGTSGKSTVTGMAGWIMTVAGREPTIMNGAVMKNFVSPDAPFASARVGQGGVFVSEVDESDGSIALYRPKVAVLLNVSLDHKSMEELRALFGDFLSRANVSAINLDDAESAALAPFAKALVTFGIDSLDAMIGVEPGSIRDMPTSIAASVIDRRDGSTHSLAMKVPGRHNLANALAAIAGCNAAGVPVGEAVAAIGTFAGLARRFDIIGTSPGGVTVIDDFGHNPEKCAATLKTLKAHPGRVIAFFQPHGYGPLRQMGAELAEVFGRLLGPEDVTILCDPVYFGGTVDRSEGSERIVRLIGKAGGNAEYIPAREDCAARIAAMARLGDRVVIMGARDDTLTLFAKDLLARLD